jgi:hypothetical protein
MSQTILSDVPTTLQADTPAIDRALTLHSLDRDVSRTELVELAAYVLTFMDDLDDMLQTPR